MARKIERDYTGTHPLFVPILQGASRFYNDLVGSFSHSFQMDQEMVVASSYDDTTPGQLQFDPLQLNPERIAGRNILVVDDIMDTGVTLNTVCNYILQHKPTSIQVVVLIRKQNPKQDRFDISPKYVGFSLKQQFVVGYGMDYKGCFRSMNHISVLTDELRDMVREAFSQSA
ncbi:MAG: phosphoribosyltransferase family protein [Planctomycetota bacterium]